MLLKLTEMQTTERKTIDIRLIETTVRSEGLWDNPRDRVETSYRWYVLYLIQSGWTLNKVKMVNFRGSGTRLLY